MKLFALSALLACSIVLLRAEDVASDELDNADDVAADFNERSAEENQLSEDLDARSLEDDSEADDQSDLVERSEGEDEADEKGADDGQVDEQQRFLFSNKKCKTVTRFIRFVRRGRNFYKLTRPVWSRRCQKPGDTCGKFKIFNRPRCRTDKRSVIRLARTQWTCKLAKVRVYFYVCSCRR